MRLRTSSGIADMARAGSTWCFGRGTHLLKLPRSMSETSKTPQIFSMLACTAVESGLERDVKASEVPVWSKWSQGSIARGRVW